MGMTSSDRRPIYVLSWIYTLFIFLPAVCQAQPTNSPPNEGFTRIYDFQKPMVAMVIIFSSVVFVAVILSYCIYRLCYSEGDNLSIPFQNSDVNRVRGLDHDTIETFPILLYSVVKKIKIGSESIECVICLNEFEDNDTLRFIPICHHVFHPDCIDSWLSSHITCPVCRVNLTEQELPKTSLDNSQSELIETNEFIDQIVIGTASEDQNMVLPSRPKRANGRFSKSHSTGHSMVLSHSMGHAMGLPWETTERYTLRLPEDMRRQILMANAKLNRVRSMNLLLDTEGSLRKGRRWNAGDEGSRTVARLKSLQIERPKKWAFWATPPFVTRGGSVRIARLGSERESSANGRLVGNARFGNDGEGSVSGKTKVLASIKTPDFCSKRSDESEIPTSAEPSV